MYCEQIRSDLPLYIDNVLDEDVKNAIEAHLPTCPLCRQKLSEYGEIRNQMLEIGVPEVPTQLLAALRAPFKKASDEINLLVLESARRDVGKLVRHWLMPLTTGTALSAALSVLFLSVLLLQPANGLLNGQQGVDDRQSTASFASTYSDRDLSIEIPERSPEVNPTGALMALTKSIVRGKMSDEEVVVVADVFGNGLANIAEVVDPPKDDVAMRELERAFEASSDSAPFLPAKIGRDSDAVRVVLKIQRVDVQR